MTRDQHIDRACADAWSDTPDLVRALVLESRHVYDWAPHRAGLVMAERGADQAWMTNEQWVAFRNEFRQVARIRPGKPKLIDALGISTATARKLSVPGAKIGSLVALSAAHWMAGHPLPIEPGDAKIFRAWFMPRFGSSAPVAEWLGIGARVLAGRLQGFEQIGAVRYERVPTVAFIRALDWVYRVGPVCPYGGRPAVQVFPGQQT